MNARLALLGSVDPGVAESEVFRLALQHAVAELGALGGTIHLRGPMSALRLVSATGLPTALTGPWEIIDQEGPLAPARALYEDFHEGRGVWIPGVAADRADPSIPICPSSAPIPGSGLAAVPVIRRDRSIGALTVITGDHREPTSAHWRFLRAVVAWAEERMVQAPLPAGPVHSEMSGDRLRQALKEVRVGSWDWHIKNGELIWDEAAMELYGTRPEEYTARVENWMRCVHPDDLGPTLALVDQAIRGHSVFEAEYRVRGLDGTYGWHQARGRATYDEHGEPLRMIGMGWDSNESRTARDALSRALRHMSDGFLAVDDTWRITFANLEAERTLGLSEAELFGQVLWDLPTVRELPDLERRCRKAAAEDRSVGFDIRVPGTGRRHHLRLVPGPDGRTLYLQDVTEKRRHEEERRAAEYDAAERAARIAELTAGLAKATTSRDVVDVVARRVLPPFAAAGLIVQTIENDRLCTVGSIGYEEDFLNRISDAPLTPGWPSCDVIINETPAFYSSPEEFAAHYPPLARLPRHSGKSAWAFLPLTASGNTFGVCSVSFDRPRGFTDEERTLLTTISALVAQALARARLYDDERSRSRELQSALLPSELPDLPACTAAARYLPAAQGVDVGGDWYDIIPLSGGQVALVVGDVMGHGLPQAATMGRLRTAVHTLADLELPPDEIMSHLNDIVGNMGEESYVTCLYALYDSITQTCSITRAGHPPPAVVHPDGTVYFPALTADPPLGAAEPPFETVELKVPEGSLLVLYTDGLVESSKREIDEGMTQLAALLRGAYEAGTEGDLEGLCDTLTAGLLPVEQPNADDAALLIARLHALTGDRVASWPLPEDPRAAGQARRHVREQLSAWGLDDLTPTTELLASELVGNVVRHAKGPVQLRLLHGAELICEVFDGSLTMPRIRRATETDEGGRGLQLITALSQRWGTRYTPTGKCIWTEQALLPPAGGRGEAPGDALELMFLNSGEFDDFPELRGLGDLS
ncbi:SpoIIE family protein phosphatase [Streptomyces sp. SID12501]|uniref:protein-serine/threonine phosphatase n=1 Tax=Streptomyces sp. SID12501 TaxID=2706042 RepID=A0A6B3C4J4_9ACTN|nr:SpoIIE family protein phosphatase [Streptomyces sp. SID12501]NEC91705.1 SpoIIE family protein phosphatase [Streptomyces sp. SID12501]